MSDDSHDDWLAPDEERRYVKAREWEPLEAAYSGVIYGFFMGETADPPLARELAEYTLARAGKNFLKGKYDSRYSFYTFLRNVSRGVLKGYRIEGIDYLPPHRRTRLQSSFHGRAKGRDPLDELPGRRPSIIGGIDAEELLRVTLLYGGKPHQLIAFGLVKLLDWRPAEIVAELSDELLAELGSRFCVEYYECSLSFLDWSRFHSYCCSGLFEKLELPVKEVYPQIEYSRLSAFFSLLVGAVALRPFCKPGNGLAQSISNWCDKVRKSVRKAYGNTESS